MNKLLNRALIVTWALVCFLGGICLDEAITPPVIVQKVHYVKQPVFIPVRTGVRFNQQKNNAVFAVLASAVQPARHK